MLDDHGTNDETGRFVSCTFDLVVEFGIVPLFYLCLREKIARYNPTVGLVQLFKGRAEQVEGQLLILGRKLHLTQILTL